MPSGLLPNENGLLQSLVGAAVSGYGMCVQGGLAVMALLCGVEIF